MRPPWLPVFAVALLLSCTPAVPPPLTVEDSLYYPLKVGTTWTYRGPDHQRTIRVVRHELFAGTPAAVVETLRNDEVIATEHVCARVDGVYGLSSNGEKLSAPLPILKLPARPGRTWRVKFHRGGQSSQGVYVLGQEEVEVPTGKYQAVTLQGDIQENGVSKMAFTYWFAPQVGMVKQLIKLPDRTLVYELEQFESPAEDKATK